MLELNVGQPFPVVPEFFLAGLSTLTSPPVFFSTSATMSSIACPNRRSGMFSASLKVFADGLRLNVFASSGVCEKTGLF
jgi:hypothetical protein